MKEFRAPDGTRQFGFRMLKKSFSVLFFFSVSFQTVQLYVATEILYKPKF